MSNGVSNVKRTVTAHLCCSCGLCSNYCKHQAITYRVNALGFYEPVVDEKKCTNCGICVKYCPGIKDLKDYYPKTIHSFYGYSMDDEMHLNASSGGIVTELLCYLISNKIVDYVTCVTTRTSENPPKLVITNDIDTIKKCRTSKYCPVLWDKVVEQIEKINGTIAVVALPCQINSLKSYFGKIKSGEKIRFYLALMCNHTPSLHAAEYVAKGYDRRATLNQVVNRGGGFPGFMTFKIMENSKPICFQTPFRKTWAAGYGRYFKNIRCVLCNDPFAQYADATFGDSYFLQKTDTLGTTFCMVRNQSVSDILQAMQRKGIITLTEGPDKTAIQQAYKVLFDREKEFLQKNKCMQAIGMQAIVPVNTIKLDVHYAYHFYKGLLISQLGKFKWLWPYLSKKRNLKNLIIKKK